MKSLKLTTVFFFLAAFLFLIPAACDKNSNDDEANLTKTEMLCREWKIITIGGVSSNEECDCDETVIYFNSNGNWGLTFKSNNQVLTDQSVSGSWKWEVQDESVRLEFQYYSEEEGWITQATIMDLQQLTGDSLWFYFVDDEGDIYKCVPK